jgi:hypothetical protein
VLQLLAQTPLPNLLLPLPPSGLPHGTICTEHGACRLRAFFAQYQEDGDKILPLAPLLVTQAPATCFTRSHPPTVSPAASIVDTPHTVGELVQMFLKTVQSGAQCFVDSPFKQSLTDLFWPRLEWRLDCPCCGKFSSAVLSEPVVRVWAGRAAAPLAAHLQRFLSERSCPCGHVMSGLRPTRQRCGTGTLGTVAF